MYLPHPPETLLQLLLRHPLPQHTLQPADQLRRKLIRVDVDVLWHPLRALQRVGGGATLSGDTQTLPPVKSLPFL